MSLSIGYGTGLKSLLASQSALQTIGNNIANANTKGYARQQVILGEATPVSIGGYSIGTGVDITKIRRIVDENLEARLLLHNGTLARLGVEASGFSELEGIVGGLGGTGLSSTLASVFSSIASLSSHPEDAIGKKEVLNNGDALARALRELGARVAGFKGDNEAVARIRVDEANSLTQQIASINKQIAALKAKGLDAHGLADQRQQLLTDLSQIVETTVLSQTDGTVRVLVSGHTVVTSTHSFEMELAKDSTNELQLKLKGGVGFIAMGNGAVAGLLRMAGHATDELTQQTDLFAKSLIFAFNQVHSTGLPSSGGFQTLLGAEAPSAGALGTGIPMKSAGYLFPPQSGDLYVSVTDTATGAVEKTKIAIDPNESLQQLATKISAVGNLSASIDAEGHLRVTAAPGHQFGFSSALDPNPDGTGAFGGAAASVANAQLGPFALTAGSTLSISVDGGPAQTITFTAGQFANIGAATATEVAAAINSQLTGAQVTVTNGSLVLSSGTTGAASSIQLTDGAGTPNAVLGFSTALDTGSASAANVKISGAYTGSGNDQWTFKPDSDGIIGVTPGLTAGVFDSQGNRIATLQIGQGYSPGEAIAVKDGVSVSFGAGSVSATANDNFTLDVVSDSDTADILVTLGLNTFFTGDSASTIEVRDDLLADPSLLAASLTGAAGDGGNLNRWVQLQKDDNNNLGGSSLTEYLTSITSNLGIETKRAIDLESAEGTLVGDLANQREQISGVSMEEEMTELVRFQQSFEAAGRYIRVLQDTTASLLELVS